MKDKVSVELTKEEAELVYMELIEKLTVLDRMQRLEEENGEKRRVKELQAGKELTQSIMNKLLKS